MADQLQRTAGEPPGDCAHGAGVRLGANPEGRGAAVSAAEQPETPHHQPEGDQPQATDVPGTRIGVFMFLRCFKVHTPFW